MVSSATPGRLRLQGDMLLEETIMGSIVAAPRASQATMRVKPASPPRASARHTTVVSAEAGWLPDGGPQSTGDDDNEAGELPARGNPTSSRCRLPGGSPQSAVDNDGEASEVPARHHLRYPADVGSINI